MPMIAILLLLLSSPSFAETSTLAALDIQDPWALIAKPSKRASLPAPETPQTVVAEPVISASPEPVSVAPVAPSVEASPILHQNEDVWSRLRQGFKLGVPTRWEVYYWREYYAQRLSTLHTIMSRAKPYLYAITESTEARGLPLELALLPAVESGFYPYAYSRSHASGLWQFIPGTGTRFGLHEDPWLDRRRDIGASTKAALDYLSYLNNYFTGDWLLAIGAYNCGEGCMRRAVEKNRQAGLPTDFWSLDLPQETKDYVPRLLAFAAIVREPHLISYNLPDIPNKLALASVRLERPLDIASASRQLGMTTDELRLINPGLKQLTAPSGYELNIPGDKLVEFTETLARITNGDRQPWLSHTLASGETLGSVAQRYGVGEEQLRIQNPRPAGNYRPGELLLVSQNVATTAHETAPALADAAMEASALGKVREVIVKTGQSLFRIAQEAGVSVTDLRRFNQLDEQAEIRPGQRLLLASSSPSVEAKAVLASKPPAPAEPKKVTYIVKLGDTVWSVAKRFNVAFNELLDWNQLSKRSELRPGDIITVYLDHKGSAKRRRG